MDIIFLLVIFFLGVLTGESYALYRFRRILRKIARKQGIDLDAEITHSELTGNINTSFNKFLRMETEQIGEVLYLYDKDSDSFICQGSSIEELVRLANQYKSIKRGTIVHNDKVFVILDGEIEELKSNEN